MARLPGGVRKIIKISEITGMEGDVISMHDIFVFKQTGVDDNRVAQGYFFSTGIRPAMPGAAGDLRRRLPVAMFERRGDSTV